MIVIEILTAAISDKSLQKQFQEKIQERAREIGEKHGGPTIKWVQSSSTEHIHLTAIISHSTPPLD